MHFLKSYYRLWNLQIDIYDLAKIYISSRDKKTLSDPIETIIKFYIWSKEPGAKIKLLPGGLLW